MKSIQYIRTILYCALSAVSSAGFAQLDLTPLSDDELAAETGQALFNISYLAPGDTGNPGANTATNTGFYTVGMEAILNLNTNIKNLQLGCGGVNGAGACDIDAQDVSFGCVANSAGVCITLPKTLASQPNGTSKTDPGGVLTVAQENSGSIPTSITNPTLIASGASGNVTQTQLKDFVLTNPFLQFAIRNPGSASTREIVGVRLGAGDVKGPLSFGSMNSFSGYLTGLADLTMRGGTDVAATCPHPNIGGATGGCNAPGASTTGRVNNGYSNFGSPFAQAVYGVSCADVFGSGGCDRAGTPAQNGNMTNPTTAAGGYLSLGDDEVADVAGIKFRYQQLTMNYQTVSRLNNSVTLSGNRQTQAQIAGLALGGVVNSLVYGNTNGSTTVVDANALTINRADSTISENIANSLLPFLREGAADQIKRQLAQGLRIYNPNATTNQTTINGRTDAQIHAELNDYVLPYNLSNFHSVEIDSNVFGLSVQKEDLQYPGYIQAVTRGWAMYVPDAFELVIDQPTTTLVQGITGNSAARDGNIVPLAQSFRNCYGTLTFC